MTCVLAAIDRRGSVHMVGDRRIVDGQISHTCTKIFNIADRYLLGFSGALGDAIIALDFFREQSPKLIPYEIEHGSFYRDLKTFFADRTHVNSPELLFGLLFAFPATPDREAVLWSLDADFSRIQNDTFLGTGSGSVVAKGAWGAFHNPSFKLRWNTKRRLVESLLISASWDYSVSPEYDYLRL